MSPISYDIHDQTRQQMIAETSRFIEWGLRHPELIVRIPAKPDDTGGWPEAIGKFFWSAVFTTRDIRRVGLGVFQRLISKLR